MRDYYRLLDVSADFTPDELAAARKKCLRRWRPDAAPTAVARCRAEEMVAAVQEGFDLLSDPARRGEYDREHPAFRKRAARQEEDGFVVQSEKSAKKSEKYEEEWRSASAVNARRLMMRYASPHSGPTPSAAKATSASKPKAKDGGTDYSAYCPRSADKSFDPMAYARGPDPFASDAGQAGKATSAASAPGSVRTAAVGESSTLPGEEGAVGESVAMAVAGGAAPSGRTPGAAGASRRTTDAIQKAGAAQGKSGAVAIEPPPKRDLDYWVRTLEWPVNAVLMLAMTVMTTFRHDGLIAYFNHLNSIMMSRQFGDGIPFFPEYVVPLFTLLFSVSVAFQERYGKQERPDGPVDRMKLYCETGRMHMDLAIHEDDKYTSHYVETFIFLYRLCLPVVAVATLACIPFTPFLL